MEPRDSTSSESEFFLVMSRIVSKLSNFCANPVTFEKKNELVSRSSSAAASIVVT